MRLYVKVILYSSCFLLALSLRLYLINKTPAANENIDLQIYRDAGRLIVNGINPYDFTDNIELRNQLRNDKDSYNDWVCSSQEIWDYCASANLPLATLFFGAVEYFFASSLAYRLFFAFFDSILAMVILAFVIKKWQLRFTNNFIIDKIPPKLFKIIPFIWGLCLGACCPILLQWGVLIPEHKGMGLLFILSAIYLSDNSRKINSMVLSPFLLGCSISFIGLGVFIVPLCLYNIYKNNDLKSSLLYCLIAFTVCVFWLIPFLPEILTMMSGRLGESGTPIHGSMWVIFYKITPDYWLIIKNMFILLFLGINIIGFIKKRLNIAVVSASLLYLFTCIYLTAGGMDRMNIALLTVIILLGYSNFFNMAFLLSVFYILYGCRAFIHTYKVGSFSQIHDARFVLLFSIFYFIFLIVQTFNSRQVKNEIKHINTGI